MRYDKKVYFVKQGEEVYDPSTGDYITPDNFEGTEWGFPLPFKLKPEDAGRTKVAIDGLGVPKWANVSDMSNERVTFLFGGLTVGAYTVRIQDRHDEPFDYIRIGDKNYNVKDRRLLRNKHVFEVSERL